MRGYSRPHRSSREGILAVEPVSVETRSVLA
jgi:hypothetical protein